MIPALDNFQRRIGGAVNQPVFAVDASRPIAGKIALQRFGLACAFKWMAQAFLDQAVDFLDHRLVGLLPIQELFPCNGAEDKVHPVSIALSSAMDLTTPRPASASAIAAKSAALLAGPASR